MLYCFFITQWYNPSKGDWTEQVQADLKDFGIKSSFEHITSYSRTAFKSLIKEKAKELALYILTEKQQSHTKTKNLVYDTMKIKPYLTSKDLTLQQKKLIFRYRTRMENFGENFRGGRQQVSCPLCETHLDTQELSFQCPEIKAAIDPQRDIRDIYNEYISNELFKNGF